MINWNFQNHTPVPIKVVLFFSLLYCISGGKGEERETDIYIDR